MDVFMLVFGRLPNATPGVRSNYSALPDQEQVFHIRLESVGEFIIAAAEILSVNMMGIRRTLLGDLLDEDEILDCRAQAAGVSVVSPGQKFVRDR